MSKNKIVVKGQEITILNIKDEDYISLSDIARSGEDGTSIINNWIRNKSTIEFLAVWERLNNPECFDEVALDKILLEAGTNKFLMSPKKWISLVGAIGIKSRQGKLGGVYAHKDIALEFAAWISPEFKLYLIKEIQRLKEAEAKQLEKGWSVKRELVKLNYRVHTDAVKNHLVKGAHGQPSKLIYASEADLLNIVVFGCTAQEFKAKNPEARGNLRDHASVEELLLLATLEVTNANYIEEGKTKQERIEKLFARSIQFKNSISDSKSVQRLKDMDKNEEN